MKILQTVLPVALVILISICSISYFTTDYIRSVRRLKQNTANFKGIEQEEFFDLNDEEAVKCQIQKIRYYEAVERSPVEHLGLPDLIEEENNLRKLASDNIFDDVGIVDPLNTNFGTLGRWIFRNTKQFQSDIIAYPYSFNYSYVLNETNTKQDKHYSLGAFITLDPDTLDLDNIGLKTNSTLKIKSARALYDADIAILSIDNFHDGFEQDLFLDAQDWCTFFQGSFGKGSCFANYDIFYNQKIKDTSKTYVTRFNETSVKDGKLLTEDGFPRFGVLIIPDYKLGTADLIKSLLSTTGINALKNYFSKGGNIIANAKSVTLLEDFGLLAKGTYDRNNLLNSDTISRKIKIKGCSDLKDKPFSKVNVNDFKKHLLCIGMSEDRLPALSTAFRMVKPDGNFKTLLEIDPTYGKLSLTKIEDGLTEELTESQKTYLPLILTKENSNSNGQIMILNFNPVYGSGDKTITLNAILLALSKEMYMSTKVAMDINSTAVPDLPIPAGEEGVQLAINTIFHNLNDEEIKQFNMYIFLPDHLEWSTLPNGCVRKNDTSSVPKDVLKLKTIADKKNDYLLCQIDSVGVYEKKKFELSLIVSDYQATQLKYNVLILLPIVSYIDSEGHQNLIPEYVRVNAEAAPVLRVAINPDPSSFYPVKGEGQYVDNVVKIENKELSNAEEVEYIGLIPIVSPLTDGDDQRILRWNLKIYVDYYNSQKYEVPFKSDNATDYIYTSLLNGKGTVMVAEWDSPTLPSKEIKSNGDIGKEVNIPGINLGKVTVSSTTEVIKQINYRKAELFYKLASQRLMVFIDDSTPEGAQTLYGGKIPAEWIDPVFGDRAKKEFLFLRNDIYFYENENYVNPPGVTEKIIFSIDKYIAYEKNKNGCVNNRGEAQSQKYTEGYFDNFVESHKAKILEPNTYTNELFHYCDLTIVDPLSESSIKSVFGNTNNLRPVHYIVPNVEKNITQPNQIYGFAQTDEHHGYLQKYPSVKFIYLHSLNYFIHTKTCIYGGIIEINLGTDEKLLSIDDVTIAPDQIAVYKTEYDETKHTIRAYFKRGLMSNEQYGKNMTLTINIENLKSTSTLKLNVKLFELKFDISFPPTYERYKEIKNQKLDFNYVSVFSYPALELKTKLNRTLNGFETMEPFSRYGVYIQELIAHRYIFGTAETHHETHPGLTGNGGGFSLISNLGISSIPFLEYVTAGSGQVIPAGTSTARASWKDVWGRTWNQPLRTVFPDIPPIPPFLKNFMMTTTYALLRNGQIVTEWNSDEDIKIHVHVKLLNNYPKYFEITRCKENQILFVPKSVTEYHSREYANKSSDDLKQDEMNGNKMLLRQGGFASYGACWATDNAVVQGQKVEGTLMKQIERAKVCADYTDENLIAACEEELKNIITLKKRPKENNSTDTWNYSPLVEKFYPKGYIEASMWDMTHVDYDDTAMDKAYKYHMDNWLPNYDNGIIKPHNTIAIPLYKGLGYDITYDKNNEMKYHGVTKRGWWCDNLQNKDDTLVAGQETCNKISVDKKSSINNWIDGEELVGSKRTGSTEAVKKIVQERRGNIYVCLYNRKRPEYKPDAGRNYYTANVNQNNIVPVIVDLEKDDHRLTKYVCNGTTQYTPDNLYQLDGNYLKTSTNKDYLYFAANLRGEAKEAFNIVMNLKHFDQLKYEGIVKVNEGGRFVYWNPANGPNSFLIVDDPVSVVNAKRNDIDIRAELFPLVTTTFNSTMYHLYTLVDENKVEKQWPFYDYYANNHGFGDVAISVYVGGIRKSRAVLEPGQTTYVKIILMNNCGFDWNMKGNAIDFEYKGSKPINANDLLFDLVHSIRVPKKYNFLEITPEKDYAQYLNITPSDHNVEVAPEFFDFENINVVTVRDGFKGEYYLKIKVADNFPEKLRGKPIEIKWRIKPEYFDHFPGYDTDEIKSYHPYTVTAPSIYIAVPYKSGKFAGKVLYTSAQAKNLNVNFTMFVDWKVQDVKFVDSNIVNKIRDVLLGDENKIKSELQKVWETLNNTPSLEFTETLNPNNPETKIVNIDGLNKTYPLFPKINIGQPDTANISFIVKTYVSELKSGYSNPVTNIKTVYNDWTGKTKSSSALSPTVNAKGPWLRINYYASLVEQMEDGKYLVKPNQELRQDEEGILKVQFKLENIGSGNCYNTSYEIIIQPNLTYIGHNAGTNKITQKTNKEGQTILNFDYGTPINIGELRGGIIYFKYNKLVDSLDNLTPEELSKLSHELLITKESSATMSLTNETDSGKVTQHNRNQLLFVYAPIQKSEVYIEMTVSGRRSDPDIEIKPIIKYNENETDDMVRISLLNLNKTENKKTRRLANIDNIVDKDIKFSPVKANITLDDLPFKVKPIGKNDDKSYKKHKIVYSVVMYNRNTKRSSTNQIMYNQEDIGISIIELVLILTIIVFFALSALFIWFGYRNMKLLKTGGIFEKNVRNTQIERLMD